MQAPPAAAASRPQGATMYSTWSGRRTSTSPRTQWGPPPGSRPLSRTGREPRWRSGESPTRGRRWTSYLWMQPELTSLRSGYRTRGQK
ncbi:unnamed protein product [Spirodela intermedia]|uniref:Uncharacterized protein n=1 Tax=Spirodela intermedia TaxID=51605 RepID=A0A7I8IPE0_SPIIN|nr:unnamed protein product [Spirodela intermedia]CAA6659650.1 unnamed protein product [Spirodela intermedia]